MTITYHRETHHSKCSKCLLLALRHDVKQSHHWSIDWTIKLCCLLTTFQSVAISAYRHTTLVSDKHVPVFQFQSVSPGAGLWCTGVVLCSQGWKWTVHITVMSCCSNSCCQTSAKLLATLLSSAPHMHKRTELLWHKTMEFTRASQLTRPQLCRLQDMDSCSWMRLSEMVSLLCAVSFQAGPGIRNGKRCQTSPTSCRY